MIRLFEFLIHGCFHHWEEVRRYQYVQIKGGLPDNIGVECRCTKCGKPKLFKLG